VAKLSTTAFTLVHSNLPDLPTLLEKLPDHILADISRKASNEDSPAVVRPDRLWHHLAFAMAVRSYGLVLGIVHAQWHPFDERARKLSCLVYCFRVVKLDVAKMAIAQLVDLQADHLNFSTCLEKVNDVLLSCVD